jgi:hypothetical protein
MHYSRWRITGDVGPAHSVRFRAPCQVRGCGEPSQARGWCRFHYGRWWKYGDIRADIPSRNGPTEERFWRCVDKEGPIPAVFWDSINDCYRPGGDAGACWVWSRTPNNKGYGHFYDGSTADLVYVHRYSYELHNGPVPADLRVDHLCCVRTCVRPSHLEAVSNGENIRRGLVAKRQGYAVQITGAS